MYFFFVYTKFMKKKNLWLIYLIVGLLQVVVVLDSVRTSGTRMLRYYTELSNLLSGFVILIYAYYLYQKENQGIEIPQWIHQARFTTVCLTTITFLIALFVLGPSFGYIWILFHGQMKYTHTFCPIVSFLLYLFLEREPELPKHAILFTLLPTILYGIVIIPLNILRIIKGPYPFLHVYEQPWYITVLWVFIILGLGYGIAWMINYLQQKRI